MVCNDCGRELEKLDFILTEAEERDREFALNKMSTAQQALNPDVYNSFELDNDAQVYAYFKAVYDSLAEAKFLHTIWERDFRRSHDYYGDLVIIDRDCYRHKES